MRRAARALAREARHALKHRGGRLPVPARSAIEARLREIDAALGEDTVGERLESAAEALRAEVGRHPALRRATVLEYVQSLGGAVIVALLIRAFIIEAFKIPTGSMIPTLLVDDHIFVNKFSFGLRVPFTHARLVDFGTPERGDIVVFEFPGEGDDKGKDFIKRFIAGPGDRVRLTDNRLVINGKPIPTEILEEAGTCADPTFAACRCVRQQEHLGKATYFTQHLAPPPVNTAPGCVNSPDWPSDNPLQYGGQGNNKDYPDVVVPEGHYFAMGDNRDNSSDGRYWGFVPAENAKGRALFLWWPPGRWFRGVE